ncbi:MAG: glycine--tRNA ligase subunit beta [Elusimicrobia bacterium]|nr:glycine--tRNA ligase subunit beta [Elusimicrobiota bacterium]
MKSALLEIGVETMPARFIPSALAQLEEKAAKLLTERRLSFTAIKASGTPMRLALIVSGVPERSEAQELELTGPPARLWKDQAGAYTKQAEGFARSHGIEPVALLTVTSPKGEVLAVRKTVPGEATGKVLGELFPALIAALEFPKTLVWEESKFRFGRPLRALCALYGKKPVRFSVAGVKSTGKTRGLAALGAKSVTIPSPEKYAALLRDRCVLVDVEERRKALRKTLETAAKRSRGRIDEEGGLLERVLFLVEHPVAVLGRFDEANLQLPAALLSMVMKTQLMFFPILGKDGALTADFIGVRDGVSEGQREVQAGFERVIAARLSDARFFFGRDRETRLAYHAQKLARVSFQKGLGTLADKTERVAQLSEWLAHGVLQDRAVDVSAVATASRLVYADLVTGVVGEFPELQGVMGGVYARAEGLDEKVALTLEQFYQPTQARGPLPAHLEGALVSLAGKLDTVCAMLAAGFKPSGSEDPFALRRLGNGAVRIVLERQLPVDLEAAVEKAMELVAARGAENPFDAALARAETLEFLWQRVESLFGEKGYRPDELKAVKVGGLKNLARTFHRLAAVHALRPDPDFVPVAAAFKRAANILKQAGVDAREDGAVDAERLSEPAERGLYAALTRLEGDLREKAAQGDFETALRALVGLKPDVDLFFEKVMVMVEDADVKKNRLALLARLTRLFTLVADISQIQA